MVPFKTSIIAVQGLFFTFLKSDRISASPIQWKLEVRFGATGSESAPATTFVRGKWTVPVFAMAGHRQ